MSLPLTVSCSSKSRLVLTSLVLPFWYLLTQEVPTYSRRAVKRLCVCVYVVREWRALPELLWEDFFLFYLQHVITFKTKLEEFFYFHFILYVSALFIVELLTGKQTNKRGSDTLKFLCCVLLLAGDGEHRRWHIPTASHSDYRSRRSRPSTDDAANRRNDPVATESKHCWCATTWHSLYLGHFE